MRSAPRRRVSSLPMMPCLAMIGGVTLLAMTLGLGLPTEEDFVGAQSVARDGSRVSMKLSQAEREWMAAKEEQRRKRTAMNRGDRDAAEEDRARAIKEAMWSAYADRDSEAFEAPKVDLSAIGIGKKSDGGKSSGPSFELPKFELPSFGGGSEKSSASNPDDYFNSMYRGGSAPAPAPASYSEAPAPAGGNPFQFLIDAIVGTTTTTTTTPPPSPIESFFKSLGLR